MAQTGRLIIWEEMFIFFKDNVISWTLVGEVLQLYSNFFLISSHFKTNGIIHLWLDVFFSIAIIIWITVIHILHITLLVSFSKHQSLLLFSFLIVLCNHKELFLVFLVWPSRSSIKHRCALLSVNVILPLGRDKRLVEGQEIVLSNCIFKGSIHSQKY